MIIFISNCLNNYEYMGMTGTVWFVTNYKEIKQEIIITFNYRPISITLIFGKIFETRFYQFLESHNCLYPK